MTKANIIEDAINKRVPGCKKCPARVGEFKTWVGTNFSPTVDSVGIRVKCSFCGDTYVKPVQVESPGLCKRFLHNLRKEMCEGKVGSSVFQSL